MKYKSSSRAIEVLDDRTSSNAITKIVVTKPIVALKPSPTSSTTNTLDGRTITYYGQF